MVILILPCSLPYKKARAGADCPRHIALHGNPREQGYRRGYGFKVKLEFSCVYNNIQRQFRCGQGHQRIFADFIDDSEDCERRSGTKSEDIETRLTEYRPASEIIIVAQSVADDAPLTRLTHSIRITLKIKARLHDASGSMRGRERPGSP
jgi:hypothetical protein